MVFLFVFVPKTQRLLPHNLMRLRFQNLQNENVHPKDKDHHVTLETLWEIRRIRIKLAPIKQLGQQNTEAVFKALLQSAIASVQ